MQISSDVHNYMETLVGQVLASEQYVEQFDNEQLADIACLALIQLKPVYIRHDIDFCLHFQSVNWLNSNKVSMWRLRTRQ